MSDLLSRYAVNPFYTFRVRVGLGILTGVVTIIVFTPLFLTVQILPIEVQRNNMLSGLIFSVGLSVYACQRTITKYIRETDLRKSKVKA